MTETPIVELTNPQRDLLERLAFRAPAPCYLVCAHQGRYALVVTTMLGSKRLQRNGAFNDGPTVTPLVNAGLIELGPDLSSVPEYSYRGRTDYRYGNQVWITDAGRAAIGRGPKGDQR